MSETKHTPGPWKIVELTDSYQIEQVADPGALIGTIYKQAYHVDGRGKANADLGNASPELLAILKKINAIWDITEVHEDVASMLHDLGDEITGLIKKAEGSDTSHPTTFL